MSNIQLRYTVEETTQSFGGVWDFKIVDQKTSYVLCICKLRKDAGMIVGLLNKAWKDIEDESNAIDQGG